MPNTQHNSLLWKSLRSAAESHAAKEPVLASFLHTTLLQHQHFDQALSFHLASKLDNPAISALLLREMIADVLRKVPAIGLAAQADMQATYQRDSACHCLATPFLFYQGFHALQAYRIAHELWGVGKQSMALLLQSYSATIFGVDIHPAARLGQGIMLDHAAGIVIGETAVVADQVSIMQGVTLGGTGKESGDRHPKIATQVLIGAGAKILGNITVGQGAHISAGSVVLHSVPEHTLVAGVPATVVGPASSPYPAHTMHQQ